MKKVMVIDKETGETQVFENYNRLRAFASAKGVKANQSSEDIVSALKEELSSFDVKMEGVDEDESFWERAWDWIKEQAVRIFSKTTITIKPAPGQEGYFILEVCYGKQCFEITRWPINQTEADEFVKRIKKADVHFVRTDRRVKKRSMLINVMKKEGKV